MTWVAGLLGRVAGDVWSTMAADWPYLLLSILAAAAVPVYLGTDRLSRWLSQRRWLAIGAAVTLATLTPFCSWHCCSPEPWSSAGSPAPSSADTRHQARHDTR